MLLQRLAAQIEYRASRLALSPGISVPDSLGTYLPFISNVRDILLSALFFSAVLAFAAAAWGRLAGHRPWRLLLVAGLIGSFSPLSARRISEAVIGSIAPVLFAALACFLVVYFLRNNYLAYFLSAGILSLMRTSYSMIEQSNTHLAIQGWLLWVLALAGMIWVWRQSNLRLTNDE